VRNAARPGLESLDRGKPHCILGNGPGAGNQKTRVEQGREICQIRNKNEIRNIYPDRALILRFLVAVFRARGIVLSLEDCPEAAPLVSARWLEAASMDDSSPAAASGRGSALGAQATPRRPPARMTSAPHPRGRDSPMTPLRPSAPLAPRALLLLRPTDRTVGGSHAHLHRRSSERGPRHPRPPPRPPLRTQVWRAAVSPPPERAGALCRAPPSFSSSSRPLPPPRPSTSSSSPCGGD